MSSALTHLIAGSQGVLTKRIDLALLETHEWVSRTLRGAALFGLGMIMAAGTWFAAVTCLVLLVTPDAGVVPRLAIFASINAGGAIALAALAVRARPSPYPGGSAQVPDDDRPPGVE